MPPRGPRHRTPARHRAPLTRFAGVVGIVAVVLLGVGPAERPGNRAPEPDLPLERATVTLHGRDGSFGVLGAGPPSEALPSGQSLAHRPVAGWRFPAGGQAGSTTVASDGTVLVAGTGFDESAEPMPIAAYRPGTGTSTLIPRVAPSIADLTPVGDMVAFSAAGPVLGLLTSVDGQWRVAQTWTGADLEVSRLGALLVLPGSGHLVVAEQPDPESGEPGGLLALTLTGPDPDGRFAATVTGRYPFPDDVYDPVNGNPVRLAVTSLHADPTRAAGEERFAVVLQEHGDPERPLVLQEYRYDAAAGTIAPASAPTISGSQTGGGDYHGYATALYDRDGNLWAARHFVVHLGEVVLNVGGGPLAVYLRPEDGGSPLDCDFDPDDPPSAYRTGSGADAEWGQACPPDYDLLQAQELPVLAGLVQSPIGDVVALSVLGGLITIRPATSEDGMSFQIGNPMDLAFGLLPASSDGLVQARLGGFDPDGRVWLAAAQSPPEPRRPPDQPQPPALSLDQWLYQVDPASLFQPAPVLLPVVPGQVARIPVSHTVTTATDQNDETPPTVDVTSRAYFGSCTVDQSGLSCSHDGVPGDGWALKHRTGYGHLAGEITYRVQVPQRGTYRVAYRVGTFPATEDARITLTVGDQEYTTQVATGGVWQTVPQAELVELPAGVHTITLAPPEGRGGWYLTWFTLRRE